MARHHRVVHRCVVPHERGTPGAHPCALRDLFVRDRVVDHVTPGPHDEHVVVQSVEERFQVRGAFHPGVMRGDQPHRHAHPLPHAVRDGAVAARCVEHREVVEAERDDTAPRVDDGLHLCDNVIDARIVARGQTDRDGDAAVAVDQLCEVGNFPRREVVPPRVTVPRFALRGPHVGVRSHGRERIDAGESLQLCPRVTVETLDDPERPERHPCEARRAPLPRDLLLIHGNEERHTRVLGGLLGQRAAGRCAGSDQGSRQARLPQCMDGRGVRQ